MAEASQQLMLAAVKSCLTSGDYSDLVITCGSDTYNVHKMIVCSRAGFFARAVRFGGKEAEERKIDLPDDEPAIVALLVQYLYEGEYDPYLVAQPSDRLIITRTATYNHDYDQEYTYDFPHTCTYPSNQCDYLVLCPHHICGDNCDLECRGFNCKECTCTVNDGEPDQLLSHAKMYEIADKYDVAGLKELCCEKFKRGCAAFWNTAAFPIAAHYVFSTTMEEDKGLRDLVSGTISEHMELIRKAEVQALMIEFNGLSLGILLKKADEHGWGTKEDSGT